MKNDIVNNIISSNYNKNNPNACSICKSEKIPFDFSKKNLCEIKILKTKFNIKESDCSNFIKKCNCSKSNPKAHKLCALLNVIYNFNLKCPECNSDYNIVVKSHKNTTKKIFKICSLIYFLFLNIIIYGASAFLIIYPIFINKNENNDPEKNKFEHFYYFFGGLIFILNTFFIYALIANALCKNSKDINDYTIDIQDISEPNKNKNNDKYYNLLYKFYRYFYHTQIRFLICKRHKLAYISKGYGYFNKELKDLIIKNHIECEKEKLLNNGGDNILKINKKDNKNGLNDLHNSLKDNEQSNGNIENVKRSSTLKEEGKKNKDNENKEIKNNTDYLPQLKNNNIFMNKEKEKEKKIKEEIDKKSNDLISNKNNSESEKSEKPKNKKLIIEIINTDKKVNENEKMTQKEEIKSKENNENLNISKISEKSKKSGKISNSSKNKKIPNSIIPRNKLDNKNQEESKNNNSFYLKLKNEDKKYIESTDLFKNEDVIEKLKIEEEEKISKKELLKGEQPSFEENLNFVISSPFHNNGK